MQKLEVKHFPVIEEKINELIEEVNDLLDMIIQQNKMIGKQTEMIKDYKESLKKQGEYILKIKEELPIVLDKAVKEQNVDVFQNWLKK